MASWEELVEEKVREIEERHRQDEENFKRLRRVLLPANQANFEKSDVREIDGIGRAVRVFYRDQLMFMTWARAGQVFVQGEGETDTSYPDVDSALQDMAQRVASAVVAHNRKVN
jgi:hypothetical protein